MTIARTPLKIVACKKDRAGTAQHVTIEATLSELPSSDLKASVERHSGEEPASWSMEEGAGPQFSGSSVSVFVTSPNRKHLSDSVVALDRKLQGVGVVVEPRVDIKTEVESLEAEIAAW